jgi:NADPH-dependent 2,4-dienoyl-CoA reductase/sulfur reductase-like enzyme
MEEPDMPDYDYLIIGGGMTADAAVKGIRQVDPSGSIGLIGAEPDPPYKRPPLTKQLWQGKALDTIWLNTGKRGVDLYLGRTATELDPAAKRVRDSAGETHRYGKLLLATGVRPRMLPFGEEEIVAFRTANDFRRLRALTEAGERFAVIGAGFIGSELAASLAAVGKEVMLLFPDSAICAGLFPPDLAEFLTDYDRQKGVRVLTGETAIGLRDGCLVSQRVDTCDRRETAVDGVASGIGAEPNVELARAAGIAIGNGIVVDDELRTNAPDVWAAGDVASFPDGALGRRRVEHEDNATAMGRRAGRNMAGEPAPYTHLPMFYSDLFDLGYEAVGDVDARLETVSDWKIPFRQGVVYYLEESLVRGVLLWGVWNRVDAARALIAAREPVSARGLIGKISTDA